MSTSIKFDSEGFDLDAAVSKVHVSSAAAPTTTPGVDASSPNDVIYEIGGAATTPNATSSSSSSSTKANQDDIDPIIPMAEEWKEKGNEDYKKQNYQSAHEKYTAAIRTIETAPVESATATQSIRTGEEILQQKDLWEQEQQLRLRNELRQRDSSSNHHNNNNNNNNAPSTTTTPSPPPAERKDDETAPPLPQFVLDPPHPYGPLLATYYCNRAAASMQLAAADPTKSSSSTTTTTTSSWYNPDDDDVDTHKKQVHPRDQEALQDCTIAILLNPQYIKAYIRRATIYEQRYRQFDLALQDMMTAQRLDPHLTTVSAAIRRLQTLEQERMDRLKEETMAKLKDLGNSILGNFGLSLDNFKTQQDPNTGSYNISFSQN